ncbi:glycine--tRNA ligase [Candidatus Micrarchaeota archaeon]|nr:glycine--tRNA ligase [Candidatus Micrarchaeota archaeon]
MSEQTRYDKVVDLALRRGLFYPSSELHGAIAGFYDYGSVGSRIKNNWENCWRGFFLRRLGEPFVEIQPAEVAPEKVFEASGHLTQFVDPITECGKCGAVERADHLLESHLKEGFEGLSAKGLGALIKKHKVKCHKCGGDLKEVSVLNMMLSTRIGTGKLSKPAYMRPETTQGVVVNFKREYLINRERLPLGIAVIGRAFRNEIAPRQTLFRMREFTQAEIQVFCDPSELAKHARFSEVATSKIPVVLAKERKKGIQMVSAKALAKEYGEVYAYYMARISEFYASPGLRVRFFEKNEEERAFYNKYQFDIEYEFEDGGWREIAGFHYRTDHDLAGHARVSGQDLSVNRNGKRVIPHIVELSFGVDRNLLALLDAGYREEKKKDEMRVWLSLPPAVAPFTAGVYPLVNKDRLPEKTEEVLQLLRNAGLDVFLDDGGSIGRRYARADEIGVPFGITIDYDTFKDDSVTVRERDSTKQERVKIKVLAEHLKNKLNK